MHMSIRWSHRIPRPLSIRISCMQTQAHESTYCSHPRAKAPIHLDFSFTHTHKRTCPHTNVITTQGHYPFGYHRLIHTGPHTFLITTEGHYPFGYLLSHTSAEAAVQQREASHHTECCVVWRDRCRRTPTINSLYSLMQPVFTQKQHLVVAPVQCPVLVQYLSLSSKSNCKYKPYVVT